MGMKMSEYIFVSCVVFAFMTLIWSRRALLDVLVKFALFLLTVWSMFLSFQAFGYVVKL